jgi:hypothetical protein
VRRRPRRKGLTRADCGFQSQLALKQCERDKPVIEINRLPVTSGRALPVLAMGALTSLSKQLICAAPPRSQDSRVPFARTESTEMRLSERDTQVHFRTTTLCRARISATAHRTAMLIPCRANQAPSRLHIAQNKETAPSASKYFRASDLSIECRPDQTLDGILRPRFEPQGVCLHFKTTTRKTNIVSYGYLYWRPVGTCRNLMRALRHASQIGTNPAYKALAENHPVPAVGQIAPKAGARDHGGYKSLTG